MSRKFKSTLTTHSLNNLVRELEDYKQEINYKLKEVVDKVADAGITTAQSNMGYVYDLGNVGYLVDFQKEIELGNTSCKCILVASDKRPVKVTWQYYNQVKSENISPLLMYEFGSGANAIDGHQGTFPRSDGKKSKGDEGSWSWMDLNGQWHTFNGIKPTRPMYNAIEGMKKSIGDIVKEVF